MKIVTFIAAVAVSLASASAAPPSPLDDAAKELGISISEYERLIAGSLNLTSDRARYLSCESMEYDPRIQSFSIDLPKSQWCRTQPVAIRRKYQSRFVPDDAKQYGIQVDEYRRLFFREGPPLTERGKRVSCKVYERMKLATDSHGGFTLADEWCAKQPKAVRRKYGSRL